LWPDEKAHGPFGELTAHCAQDVTKAWSAALFEVIRRRTAGERAALPLKKRSLVAVTWRKGEFRLTAATQTGGESGAVALPGPLESGPGLVA
jgi:hypothetical protein